VENEDNHNRWVLANRKRVITIFSVNPKHLCEIMISLATIFRGCVKTTTQIRKIMKDSIIIYCFLVN
jgi:hypothetical protein